MSAEQALQAHLDRHQAPVRMLEHPACRTSVESAAARASAGFPDAVGAKALIVVRKDGYAMLVLPGMRRLDSKRVRGLIGKFRFARPDEVREATGGLEIGTIPPFGQPVYPLIEILIVDTRITGSEWIGFNAACLTRSAVMSGSAYLEAARPDRIEDISLAGEMESGPGG
jgi:prolyl-tRNA editing enzyme YbaK/EbsC (Cys-tRNA(Pro) deacylase)